MSDGRTRPMIVASTKTDHRRGKAGQEQRRQRRRHGEIGGAHQAEQLAIADAVAGHAEQGRDQGAEELQGAEDGQRQDRAGRDQHEPAQDHAFHLEGPGGQQVGRPLEAEAPDLERRQRRYARDETHVLFVPSPGRRLAWRLSGQPTVRFWAADCNYRLGMGHSRQSRGLPIKALYIVQFCTLKLVDIRPCSCVARRAQRIVPAGMPLSGGSRSREPHADVPMGESSAMGGTVQKAY